MLTRKKIMKYTASRLLMALWLTGSATATVTAQKNIFVVSDPHVMAPELIEAEGEAFNQVQQFTPLVLKEGRQALACLIDTIISEQPDLVLITGGLTHGGEKVSHQLVVSMLDQVRARGIPVVVVPGCCDIDNPDARYFNGATTRPAERISAAQFAEIYSNFGYADAFSRDAVSLSYAIEPLEGLVLLAIDTNEYEKNHFLEKGDDENFCETTGRIKYETLEWMTYVADEAKSQGKQVIAMMHHNAIEHFDDEYTMMPFNVISNWDYASQQMVSHGIRFVVSGHQYISDMAKRYTTAEKTDSLVEATTCSLVSYPNHWRSITASSDYSHWNVATRTLSTTPTAANLTAISRQQLIDYSKYIMEWLIMQYWPEIETFIEDYGGAARAAGLRPPTTPEETIDLAKRYFADLFTEMFLIWAEGNEQENERSEAIFDEFDDKLFALLRERSNIFSAMAVYLVVKPELEDNLMLWMNSILKDLNQYGTDAQSRTDDHRATFAVAPGSDAPQPRPEPWEQVFTIGDNTLVWSGSPVEVGDAEAKKTKRIKYRDLTVSSDEAGWGSWPGHRPSISATTDVNVNKSSELTLSQILIDGADSEATIHVYGTLRLDSGVYVRRFHAPFVHVHPNGSLIWQGGHASVAGNIVTNDGGTVVIGGGHFDGTFRCTSNSLLEFMGQADSTVINSTAGPAITLEDRSVLSLSPAHALCISGGGVPDIDGGDNGTVIVSGANGGTVTIGPEGKGTIWVTNELHTDGSLCCALINVVPKTAIRITGALTRQLHFKYNSETDPETDTPYITGGNGYELTADDANHITIDLPEGYTKAYDAQRHALVILTHEQAGINGITLSADPHRQLYDLQGRKVHHKRRGHIYVSRQRKSY